MEKPRPPAYIESHSALRGIAAVAVVLEHLRNLKYLPRTGWSAHLMQPFYSADVAVFLFFILSGYVMSHVYPSPVRWGHFFTARLARLLPVYEITLIVAWTLSFFIAFPTVQRFSLLANALMIQQWLPFDNWHSINIPAWSLSIEAFLYVFAFPFLVFSRQWPFRLVLYFAVIAAAATWGTLYFNHNHELPTHSVRDPLISGLLGFGCGFALHSMGKGGLSYPKVVCAAALILTIGSFIYKMVMPDSGHCLLVMGLMLLIVSSADPLSWTYRLLARSSLLFFGDISYSLYLWHFSVMTIFGPLRHWSYVNLSDSYEGPAFRFALACLIFALSVAISVISYRKLEVPFRRFVRDRFVRPKPGAVLLKTSS